MVRISTITPVALACVCVLSGCVQPPALLVESATGDVVPLEAWNATVTSYRVPSELRGNAMLIPGRNIQETRAEVTLAGAAPNAVHPWFVQLGECGNDRGVLAGLTVYPPIAIDENGEGRVSVMLPFTLPTSGRYFVSVRRSETEVSTVIACGNFAKAGATAATAAGYAKVSP